LRTTVDVLEVEDLSADAVRKFLAVIEEERGCSVATRNQRLSAIHALAHFIGERSPEHSMWCGELQSVPFKRTGKNPLTYLEKAEIDALLASPDPHTEQGRKDHALLLFSYNSGARASEAAGVKISDLDGDNRRGGAVRLCGKGAKTRLCPLWPRTMTVLAPLIAGPTARQPCFPEPLWCSGDSLRNPHSGRKACEASQGKRAVSGEKAS